MKIKLTSSEEIKKKTRQLIIKHLRKGSLWNPSRKEAMRRARVSRGYYQCAHCCAVFHVKEIHVDHIIPVVPLKGFDDWNGYIARLFCDESGLQILCVSCHKKKTDRENELRV